MELFAGRGPATASCGDEACGCDHCFAPEPPRHPAREPDSSMLVIRDALLSQLQQERLRQEIIVAELAKIERAMALRSSSADADRVCQWATFSFLEEIPRRSVAVGPAGHGTVAADVDNDLKKEDGVCGGVELESQKPDRERLVRESLKTAGNAAGQQNAALIESKLHESNETMLPKKTTPSVKWSCDICRVEAPTEGHLQQHFAGQKHRSKVATLVSRSNANSQKAKTTTENSRNLRQYNEKPHLVLVCRFCQSNCTCKLDLENHLGGKRHKAKIQSLLEECKKLQRIVHR